MVNPNELDEIIEAVEDSNGPTDRAEFTITSDETASWALRRIRKAREDHAQFAAECQARIDRLQKSIDEINTRLEADRNATAHSEAFLSGKLAEYFGRIPADKIKAAKTQRKYRLPEGDLIVKSQEPTITRDNEKLVAWLKANDRSDMIKVEETPRWADLKKTLVVKSNGVYDPDTGEQVPGVSAISRPDVFEVKF